MSSRSYSAGMPQLAYAGLSENWLLKECGDLHWDCLARGYGMTAPDFRDVSGEKAYAAFTAIRVSEAVLDGVAENDRIQLDCTIAPAQRAQFFSRHVVTSSVGAVAQVEMLSAFVFRKRRRDNRSVERAVLRLGRAWGTPCSASDSDEATRFAEEVRARRHGQRRAQQHVQGAGSCSNGVASDCGTARNPSLPVFTFSPCPNNDFNGANFMYFATFAALVDRAEWRFFKPDPLLALVSREIFYYGNVNVGEDIAIRLLESQRQDDGGLRHRCLIVRAIDGCAIAEVLTHKRSSLESRHDR
jgi:probable biosynthetic protein (TIGR04099 family)